MEMFKEEEGRVNKAMPGEQSEVGISVQMMK